MICSYSASTFPAWIKLLLTRCMWAADGTPDTFRIRIWWEDAAREHDVYDNGVDQEIGGGSIVVHTGR